jgi:hypothetical protein
MFIINHPVMKTIPDSFVKVIEDEFNDDICNPDGEASMDVSRGYPADQEGSKRCNDPPGKSFGQMSFTLYRHTRALFIEALNLSFYSIAPIGFIDLNKPEKKCPGDRSWIQLRLVSHS